MKDYQNLDIRNIDKGEVWTEIDESKGCMLSSYGRVKLVRPFNGSYIKAQNINDRYVYVSFSVKNKSKHYRISRLVAKYFVPNPFNKPYVNHVDGDKLNNRASNLEWVTASENMHHAYSLGLKKPTKKQYRTR